MGPIVRAALAGLLLAGISATGASSEPEVCVADDELLNCDVPLQTDLAAAAPDQEVTTAPLEGAPLVTPADRAAITTRTIGPPVVVQPFASAAPAAAQTEPVRPLARPVDQPKLPPGPPNRLP